MCLFGEILRKMENLGEKSGERSFKGCLVGRGSGKKWVGLGVFSPGPPKSFLPKMRRKLGGEAH